MEETRHRLEAIGLEPGRLKMVHLSSAMGTKFAEEARLITEEIRTLGPSPLSVVRSGGDR